MLFPYESTRLADQLMEENKIFPDVKIEEAPHHSLTVSAWKNNEWCALALVDCFFHILDRETSKDSKFFKIREEKSVPSFKAF